MIQAALSGVSQLGEFRWILPRLVAKVRPFVVVKG